EWTGKGVAIELGSWLGATAVPLLTGLITAGYDKPFYAFNSDFERGSLFHHLGFLVEFHNELNKEKFEAKRFAVSTLKIPNYDDPFNDNGLLCSKAWERGEINEAIAHNRSCLLKERDILLKRGFREPNILNFVKD
ncbi:MAG: hypothetical protein KJ623_02670, partial [Nanoarchaeota archaeon]|nr:hypothetical protein [Nanoarchaeota archaeon]